MNPSRAWLEEQIIHLRQRRRTKYGNHLLYKCEAALSHYYLQVSVSPEDHEKRDTKMPHQGSSVHQSVTPN